MASLQNAARRERADRVGGLLEALTARAHGVLADRLGALDRNAACLDHRLDIGAGEVGELLGNLLAALDEFLAALTGIGEQRLEGGESGDGFKAGENIL